MTSDSSKWTFSPNASSSSFMSSGILSFIFSFPSIFRSGLDSTSNSSTGELALNASSSPFISFWSVSEALTVFSGSTIFSDLGSFSVVEIFSSSSESFCISAI